ncbi:MAG TPA: hypothetical protein DCQ83_08825 [Fibrobacteres bacterium]|jgi:uncharacterized membrane protein YphA (DoxX/SURF4 family)|nr:hypothetical protein [Fibrobacterota bacterium]
MHKTVLAAMFLFAALLGVGNNLINSNKVPWTGSAEVLPKPEGWPSLTLGQGISGGAKFAWREVTHNRVLVVGALLILSLLIRISMRQRKPISGGIISWLRIALGLMFLVAAYPKFSDPKAFAMLVTQYQLLPAFAVNLFSIMLPAFEITTGLVLILTPFEKEGSAALLLLLLMFIVALSQAMSRGLGIACGCFDIEGAADARETWFALLRDIVLLAPVTWMWFKAQRRYLWRL